MQQNFECLFEKDGFLEDKAVGGVFREVRTIFEDGEDMKAPNVMDGYDTHYVLYFSLEKAQNNG